MTTAQTGTPAASAADSSHPVPGAAARGPAAHLTGTGTLLRFMLRRDRLRLSLWVLGIGLMSFYVANAVQALVADEAELTQMAVVFRDPVGRLMTGPAFGMDAPTFERFYAAGYVLFIYILSALMSMFTVVRHTRAEEASGGAELVRAGVIGQHAPLTAAMLLALLANAGAAILVVLGALSAGFAVGGSLLVGGSNAAVGLLFAGAAAVVAQVTESSRAASAMTGALLGLAYLLRMGGDLVAAEGSALSWFSPLGWSQQTAPYVEDRWWPLIFSGVLAAIASVWAYRLSSTRDLGAGLFPSRPGPARARSILGTPSGVAVHVLRGGLRGWAVALVLCGAMFGSYAQTMADAGESLPQEFRLVFPGDSLMLGFLAYTASFLAIFVAAAGVSGLQQLRAEELCGRLDLLLSAPFGRGRWLLAQLSVLLGGLALILLLVGLAAGGTAVAVLQDEPEDLFAELVLATVHQACAVLAVLGLVVAAFGWAPRIAGTLGWVLIGYAAFMTNFGRLLDLPDVLSEFNVFGHLAQYPVEAVEWGPVLWLSAIGVGGIILGFVGWRHRAINSG